MVLNAHRSQPRKRMDLTLKGFALFAKDKPPNVQLYLHMGVEDVGWNVAKLATRYGIFDRLILSQGTHSIPNVDTTHLNLIYNACDVGINSAMAEGWGLPTFEHAAAGKAQIVPRFGALEEIWSEAAEFLEPSSEVVFEQVLSEGRVVSPEAVASALERLYFDSTRRRQVAMACHERTRSNAYSPSSVASRWQEILGSPSIEATSSKKESVGAL